jgi:hypothetical protein
MRAVNGAVLQAVFVLHARLYGSRQHTAVDPKPERNEAAGSVQAARWVSGPWGHRCMLPCGWVNQYTAE